MICPRCDMEMGADCYTSETFESLLALGYVGMAAFFVGMALL